MHMRRNRQAVLQLLRISCHDSQLHRQRLECAVDRWSVQQPQLLRRGARALERDLCEQTAGVRHAASNDDYR